MKCDIKITKETRERLKMYGHMGDTYDSAINRLLDDNKRLRREKAEHRF